MLITAFIFGLLGSFHCVGMCGPIAFIIPLDRESRTKSFFQILSYHSGRIITYSLLGLLFGFVGSSLQLFGLQQNISIIIGVLMIGVVLLPKKFTYRFLGTTKIYSWVGRIKSGLGSSLKKKSLDGLFTIGFLNGLLPCGLVYLAVFGSISTANAGQGALYMLFFGLGTIPLMTTAIYLGNFLKQQIRRRILKAIPVFIVLIGCLFILRGMGLGIPYVSPSKMVAEQQMAIKHSCH